jgi:hypothetical protein
MDAGGDRCMTLSAELRDQFIERRAQGQTMRKISEDLGISYNTACGWNNNYREQIAAARAFYLEELEEKFYLTTEARLQFFGDQLETIKAEISRRDLSDVKTDRLFELLISCYKKLHEEYVEPQFFTEEEVEAHKTSRIAREERNKIL